MAAFTDYAENQLLDYLFRGQAAPTLPTSWFFGLVTVAGSDSAAGTEVTGGSYARVGVARSLANFAGTQGAGTTVASSGTGGTTSNNVVVTFAAPTANWGSVVGFEIWDALTGGNRWVYGAVAPNKTVNNGDPAPNYPAATFTFQIDN